MQQVGCSSTGSGELGRVATWVVTDPARVGLTGDRTFQVIVRRPSGPRTTCTLRIEIGLRFRGESATYLAKATSGYPGQTLTL